ncbi:hypothetical protein [Lyngbya aestuarii]|uniref:hypothetical protein n=1 Tax=Lyngbya aestuarii TaxID=118322 RepID=UPI00403DB1D6
MAGNPAFERLLIINSFSGEFLSNLFSTHPSTEARIQQLVRLEEELSISDYYLIRQESSRYNL